MRITTTGIAAAVTAALCAVGSGLASAQDAWSYPVYRIEPLREIGSQHVELPALSDYAALETAERDKRFLCVLLPTTQDSVFVAYMHGAIAEAERLGQSLTIFDAGGYGQDANQRAQFENCTTLGADAILLQPIGPGGWENDIARARQSGVAVVNIIEPVDSLVDARVVVDFRVNGRLLGEAIAAEHPADADPVNVLVMPGTAGLPFVEDTVVGIEQGLEGSSAKVLKVMYGGLDAASQLQLLDDAMVAFTDIDYIVGAGVTIKQAVNVLERRGDTDTKLLATYLDETLLEQIRDGRVMGGTAESSTRLTMIGVNLALAALEGEGGNEDMVPNVGYVTADNADDPDIRTSNFAPEGWDPVFKVD